MSRATAAAPAAVRTDLLARLGLGASADDQAVETAHDHIVEFLGSAPEDLRGWADRRQAEVDKVFALLTGPESELAALAHPVAPPTAAWPATPPPAAWPAGGAGAAHSGAPVPAQRGSRFLGMPLPLAVVLGVFLFLLLVGGVYWAGRPDTALPEMTNAQGATPTQQQGPAPVDQAQVAELMKKIQANPKDVASYQALGDIYYQAGDFTQSRAFLGKALAVDPTNEKALIGAGAAAFSADKLAEAEQIWTRAASIYPKNPEIHYDLGFLYMMSKRPEKMRAEWDQVVKLAPDSELAKSVQAQVGAIKGGPAGGTGPTTK